MDARRRIVVIGATSGIAEHCCRLWLQEAASDLVLVARDAAKLDRIAADLRVRSPASTIATVIMDFLDTEAIRQLAERSSASGPIDIVLIAHGVLSVQGTCEADLAACREALEVNAVSPALFAEAFARNIAKVGKGTICIIGSVAGDRGRKANYVYGSSKGLLSRYAEGMEHRFAGTGVRIVLAKPGPTDTPMSAHLKAKGKRLASAESVARDIVRAIAKGKPLIYAPWQWRWIMMIVRHLPRFIFNRLNI